jgi:cbb3-type cytochrome oxidase maturation protein
LVVASGFLIAFLWAVRSGQFEDDYTPSVRMLHDDELLIDTNFPNDKADETETRIQS